MMAAVQSNVTTGVELRARALREMGFCAREALVLAAVQPPGQSVDIDRVKQMLDAGCRRDLAVRILL
jgi:hypothetical protein